MKESRLPTVPQSATKEEGGKQIRAEKKTDKSEKKSVKKEKQPKGKPNDKGEEQTRPIEDVTRLEIRVGMIVKAWSHPEADKLYCEEIDIGEESPRQIASGLREHVSHEEFEGQKVLVLCNTKEKKLRGFPSHGMVLCGKKDLGDGKERVELVKPPKDSNVSEEFRKITENIILSDWRTYSIRRSCWKS
ncbi:tRNA-binding protein YgjH-like [Condylostylus longicornis]|uniref:tRNA-binding protein YgjH-like n=1 Tax=Condylostylus longicornis TaxID=2530218 RepID=UPI00244E538A|nr:tRNA-binding protein YgjH-like [Condylostylus longicornis]